MAKDCTVIDGFCGSGGNVIQFSKFCKHVYAIDINPDKIKICKKNCEIYNCEDNISFIECDFLKIDQYEKKVFADYIFLSPPWGGINYKKSDIYSIKASMKPDIHDIVKMCLKVSKYIMFYVPRTLKLEELFNIISDITKNNKIFLDVKVLQSACKIKALLIIFGYNIDDKITEGDLIDYLKETYSKIVFKDSDFEVLKAIAKIIGNFRFLQGENEFRKNHKEFFEENKLQDTKIIDKTYLINNNNNNLINNINNNNINIPEKILEDEEIIQENLEKISEKSEENSDKLSDSKKEPQKDNIEQVAEKLINYLYNEKMNVDEKIKLKSLNLLNFSKNKQQNSNTSEHIKNKKKKQKHKTKNNDNLIIGLHKIPKEKDHNISLSTSANSPTSTLTNFKKEQNLEIIHQMNFEYIMNTNSDEEENC